MKEKTLIISDLHCGDLCGLTPERLFDKRTVITQKPLWEWYIETLKKIGPVKNLILLGDLVDGPGNNNSVGHITTDTAYQRDIAIECIELVKTKNYIFNYGTPYHVTGSEDWEKEIAKYFGAGIRDINYLDICGHMVRTRHVVGRSDIPYGQGTQLYKEAVQDTIKAREEGAEPAEWYFHAHVHYCFRIGNYRQTVMSNPCLQTPGNIYGRKCRSTYYDIGMIEIQADKDGICPIPHVMPKFVFRRKYEKY